MGRPVRIFIIVALGACAFAAVACSGGAKKPSASDATATSTSSELQGVRDRFNQATFKGTYKVAPSTDPTDPLANGTIVIYKDGADRFRFDVTAKESGQDTKVIFIQNSDASWFCLDNAGDLGAILGIDASNGVCLKSDSSDGSSPVAQLSSLFSDVAADGEILEKTTRPIAGQDATCFKVKAADTGTTSTSCFAANGVMLYSKVEGADDSELEATDVGGNVVAKDFELPYAERAFPTGTDGTTP